MKSHEVVIAINPGSTSTKFALFNREEAVYEETVRHSQEDLSKYELVTEQLDFRYQMIKKSVDSAVEKNDFTVVGCVGRGGPVKPLEGGTYIINETLLEDLKTCRFANHASNLGGIIADKMASDYGINKSYIVDPVTTDNMWDKARISGFPGIERACRVHALNIKSVARKTAEKIGKPFPETNFVVAHLGGGISIAAVEGDKIRDVNDGLLGMGPFSPERAGALPLRGVMKLCYEKPENEVKKLFAKKSGFMGYLGKNDFREIIEMVEKGDEKAFNYYKGFVYQIAKEIGAYFTAMKCCTDGIIITGGIAYNERFINDLSDYIGKLSEVHVVPGENELPALAEGAFRIIDGKETAKEYN
ncbi:MAG: butyrate kinase [bacterium]